jgi:hypothetical protein
MNTYVLGHTLGITLNILHSVVTSDIGHLYRLIMLTKFESETS